MMYIVRNQGGSMIPTDLRHYHIPFSRRVLLRAHAATEIVAGWLSKNAVRGLSRGETIAVVVGLSAMAALIYYPIDWVRVFHGY